MRKKSSGTNSRLMRINDEMLRECAKILRGELKDPRIGTMVSVTKADTTSDLSYCKIYVSILGDESEKKETLLGLKNASGFIRSRLAQTLNLRNTPELRFVLDDSLEYSMKISKLINEANGDLEE